MESGVIPTGLEHVRQARVLEVELVSHSQLVRYAPRCEVVVACERHYALEAERLARRESIAPELGRDSLLPSVARNGPSDLDLGNCQMLWIGGGEVSQAATFSSVIPSSWLSSSVTRMPSLNFTPSSTSATRWWPLNRRQRSWAVVRSL